MASAAAHPMHGQWTWQSTPTGPGAALEDSAPTCVFIKKKGRIRALTVRFGSGGPRIHSSRHGALWIFDEKKKSCAPPVEQQMLTKTPPQNKRFSANPQGDGNRNRDTDALAKEYAQNSKTIMWSQEQ